MFLFFLLFVPHCSRSYSMPSYSKWSKAANFFMLLKWLGQNRTVHLSIFFPNVYYHIWCTILGVSHRWFFMESYLWFKTSPLLILVSNSESVIALHVRAIVAIVHCKPQQNCKRQFFYYFEQLSYFQLGLSLTFALVLLYYSCTDKSIARLIREIRNRSLYVPGFDCCSLNCIVRVASSL